MNDVKPSEMKWTKEQQLAINLRGGNLLVTAAAGSGKTAVLTERLMQRITSQRDPADIRRFVVVTFTKPAAAEMKSRLTQKLTDYIKEHPSNRHAKRQIMYVPDANISTIDSFCLSLIERYQAVAKKDIGYMPGIRILSESEEKLLLDKAINEAVEAEYEKGEPTFYSLLDALDTGKTGSDAAVKSAVGSVYSMLRISPEPERLRENMLSSYGEAYSRLDNNPWFSDIYENLITATDFYLKKVNGILAETPEEREDEKIVNAFADMALALKNDASLLASAAKAEDYNECRRLLSEGITKVKATRSKKHQYEWCSAVYELKEDFKSFWDEAAASFSYSEAELKEEGELLYPIISKLFEIAEITDKKYSAIKKEKNVWDFSDMELKAKELLWEKDENGELYRSEISLEESRNYDEILIDEYQDVNELQELIFRGISSENEDNVFMVGDVKQSIYGFRGATPELFLKRREEYLLALDEDTEFPAKVALNANFRSRKGVTDAVNAVFSAIMKKTTCGMEYLPEDQLNPMAEYPQSSCSGSYLTLIDKEQDEASYVAAKIKELVDGKMLVKGHGNGELRPIEYGDIAILLRNAKANSARFVQALSTAGIPVCAPASTGFLASPSVKKVISVLCAIDNPMKDINLAAAMCGGVFGFTESDLIRIRQKNDGAFYYAVKSAAEQGDEKSLGFIEKLQHLRRRSSMLTAEKLIWYLYKTTGYLSFVKTLPNGKKEYENLMHLMEHAKAFGMSGRQDLSGYVAHLERLISKGEKGEGKPFFGDNEVQILTIHKSKGLEFPVCFICCTAGYFSNEDLKKRILTEPSAGVGIRLSIPERHMIVNTLARKALIRKLKEKQRCEEMRLLYVAMTRARERLEIVGTVASAHNLVQRSLHSLDVAGFMDEYPIKNARSYLDWLLPVAVGTDAFKLSVLPSWQSVYIRPDTDEVPDADVSLADRIYGNFTAQYPYASAFGVPTKMTVSEIVALQAENDDADYCCERKPACMNVAGNSSAEAGTAFHAFLQFADFSGMSSYEQEIERLVAERFITERQGKLIDRRKLKAFLGSEIFARITAAENVTREFRFTFEADASEFIKGTTDERILIQGAIDCVFEEKGKCVVVDYKTDRIMGNLDQKVKHYSPQLELYARGLKELTGKEVSEGVLYFLDTDEAVRVW